MSKITLAEEGSTPSTPATGKWKLYTKSDGLYLLDDAGTETAFAAQGHDQTAALYSGTYTPTLYNTTNVAASTAYTCQYIRVGSVVTVSGKVSIDTTTTGDTQLGISLPFASAIVSQEQLGGVAYGQTIAEGGGISGDATNDRALLRFQAVSTANNSWYFIFNYIIVA